MSLIYLKEVRFLKDTASILILHANESYTLREKINLIHTLRQKMDEHDISYVFFTFSYQIKVPTL